MSADAKPAPGILTPPRLDVAAVAALVRDELRRRARLDDRPAPNWLRVEADLEAAEESAPVGVTALEVAHAHGLRGLLVRLMVKCVFRLARPITRRQRLFNASVLNCLYAFKARVRRLEDGPAVADRVARLEALLAEQAARIRQLEQALAGARPLKAG
ncbi:MAG TPA: hypothetical protein VFA26_16935 [Gemmataceae bacterium]|nr:hypothetical protein [Gemmataceae bacterium]